MSKEFYKSAVVRDDKHNYYLGDKVLSGVTRLIKWVYPDTYKDVPQSVLEKAAEHGTKIHELCEAYDAAERAGIPFLDVPEEKQAADYLRMKKELGLHSIANEYRVDDGVGIASDIDAIYAGSDDEHYFLADFKTTSEIHVKNVRLQLSIYADLFEFRNPGLKVEKIAVIWLPKPQYGEAKVMELKRIPYTLCQSIIDAFNRLERTREKGLEMAQLIDQAMGEAPEPKVDEAKEPALVEEALPATLKDAENEIIRIETQMAEMKKRADELKSGMLELMIKHNVKKWQSDRLQIVRKLDSTRTSVDSTKLKKQYPDVYAACCKTSVVKGSITIKVL